MTVDDTFETKFDKELNVNNIEHIYYLQLNNRLLDKLNIINKIKLCGTYRYHLASCCFNNFLNIISF